MAATFGSILSLLRRAKKPAYFLALPAAYLAGQAYHEGYLKHFGIAEGLFPIDVTETYRQAFIGFIALFTQVMEFLNKSFENHPLWSIFLFVLTMIFVAAFFHQRRPVDASRPKPEPHPKPESKFRRNLALLTTRLPSAPEVIKDFGRTVFVVLTLTYFMFVGLIFFLLVSVIIIRTFLHVGDVAAARDQGNDFEGAATAYVRRSNSIQEEAFSVLVCGQQFCALYSQTSKGFVAPISSITWVDHAQGQPMPKGGGTKDH
ncbi:hypothetical protein [Dyella sp. C11]|uniref:hypothetical protein n=1 Tax=Dyella sp. C11 TaxID=2126991 RepID=UPI000D64C95E|nr:hypothetical protein [Dyella sp. C11]